MKPTSAISSIVLLVLSAPAMAQPEATATIDIMALIDKVSDDVDREFLVDPRMPARMRQGTATLDDADYDTLLGILRLNGFVTVETSDQIMIVPVQVMRQLPSRILTGDDARVSDHEVVTRIFEMPDDTGPDGAYVLSAAQMIPMLRPMFPTEAQIVSPPGTNTMIITDTYDNVRRITAILEALSD